MPSAPHGDRGNISVRNDRLCQYKIKLMGVRDSTNIFINIYHFRCSCGLH